MAATTTVTAVPVRVLLGVVALVVGIAAVAVAMHRSLLGRSELSVGGGGSEISNLALVTGLVARMTLPHCETRASRDEDL